MANQPIARRLPPESEPWGRSVDERIALIEGTSARAAEKGDNALRAISGTLGKLSEQVKAIDTLTQELAEQQTILTSQQNTLASQQAQLSAQVAQIQSLVERTVVSATLGNTVSGTGIPGGGAYVTLSSSSIAVPAGYTRVLILAVGTVRGTDLSGTTPNVRARFVIDTSVGSVTGGGAYFVGTPNDIIGVVCHTKTSLANVSGTITLHLQGASSSGLSDVTADPDAIVLFLR